GVFFSARYRSGFLPLSILGDHGHLRGGGCRCFHGAGNTRCHLVEPPLAAPGTFVGSLRRRVFRFDRVALPPIVARPAVADRPGLGNLGRERGDAPCRGPEWPSNPYLG